VYKTINQKNKEQLKRMIDHKGLIRLSKPRITPLEKSKWNEDVLAILGDYEKNNKRPVPNIFTTLANHPKLYKRWGVFGNHVLFKSSLPVRDREILILRIGWLCRSVYEWGQHVVIGKQSGLTEENFRQIVEGADAKGLDPFEANLLRAVDELYIDSFISDKTWNRLAERYNTHQLMDVIFTVGQYNLVSMALNTLGVQPEEGLEGFPK
jgi:4-carboxymuconolactone decarboxylase